MSVTTTEPPRRWHFERDGRQWGPLTDDELLELLHTREITAATRVWREGMAQWQPIGEVLLAERAAAAAANAPSVSDPSGASAQAAATAPVVALAYESPIPKVRDVRYAGFWDRAVALLVDLIIIYAVLFLISGAIWTVTRA